MSLLQLIAYGAQDVYLTGNPDINFYKTTYSRFRIYYKKHIINDIVYKIEITGFEFIEYIKIKDNKINIKDMFNESLTSIDCSNLNINKLPRFKNLEDFDKLKYFICSNNRIKNVEKLKYINIIKLDCSYNQLEKIPQKMKSIEYFDFSNNKIKGEIDFANYPKLKYLMASSNKINKISFFPEELIYLDLSNNPIECIDNLPNSLETLLIVQTNIKTINFTELTNLKYLDISINNLKNMDGLPYGLNYLNCSQTDIDYIDNLPTTITKLICINNNLKSINMLPETITYLDCSHNKITHLNDLPNDLLELKCTHNELTYLNNLPPKLSSLDCSNNKLHPLTNIPKSLKKKNIINKNNEFIDKNNDIENTTFLKNKEQINKKDRKYMELSMRKFGRRF